MKYLKKYELFEKKEEKKFTSKNRIILLGPPTIGKSTISKALGEKLDLEVISLDMLQKKFGGFGEKEEIECVEYVISHKINTPSILDFGGGQVYRGNVKDLLKGYNNIFVLIPSEDYELSQEILKSNHEDRLKDAMKQPVSEFTVHKHVLKSLESPNCEFSESKKKKLISICKKMIAGGAGKFEADDIPKSSLEKFGNDIKNGFETGPNWMKYHNLLTKENDKINRSLTDNIIEVYTEGGNRRSVSSIVNEIVKNLKLFYFFIR